MTCQIDRFVLGPLETNSYVIRCDGACWVVDPSLWPRSILEFLAEVRATARGRGNMMPVFLRAVKAYASLGEITDVLREEFGTYREPAIF